MTALISAKGDGLPLAAKGEWDPSRQTSSFERPEPRSNAAMRLICFPYGGGGAQAFRGWAAALPPEIELLAYQPPGRGRRRRDAAIEDMPRLLQTLQQELSPFLDRPFALFGHSVGALIAFEVARALQSAGKPAPLRLFLSGYSAPDIAERAEPMHRLSDEALWQAVAGLGLSPELGGADEELRALALPPIRADFRLSETHRVDRAAPPIAAPLTLLAGASDAIAPADSMAGWRSFTEARPVDMAVLKGGHFFIDASRDALLDILTQQMTADLAEERAARPPSIIVGAPHEAPADNTLDALFREQAARSPDALAIEAEDRRLDFAELDRLSDLLARKLARLGAGRDRLVGLFLETSADYMVAYLATLKAGAAYLPLDPASPASALARALETFAPVAVATRPALEDRLPSEWRDERVLSLSKEWPALLEAQDDGAPIEFDQPRPQDLAYAVASSGTTGAPKAILCPHQGAVISYWWRYRHLPYGEDEREAANVFFVWEALRPLLQGRPLHPIPDAVIYDPVRLVDHLERHRITRVLFTPSLLEQILRASEMGALGDLAQRLGALRVIVLNGEVVTAPLWRRARRALAHVRLVNDYSLSETHDVCHIDLSARSPEAGDAPAPAGMVMDGVSAYILDEKGAPVPWGETGEVYVGGATLARGYLGHPEETAARFPPDPFCGVQGARMFRTGDLGRLEQDGALNIAGRAKFLIKLRGYSIVPGEVEAALAAHPGVSAAAALPADDPASGVTQGVVAFYAEASPPPDQAALRAHLKELLPGYAVPARLIPLDPWPIDAATGKLDRRRLPDPWRALQQGQDEAASALITLDETRAALAELWRRTLGESPTDPQADFFDLGGHSLKAVELSLAIEQRFGQRIDVVDLFDHPRLDEMAAEIDRRRQGLQTQAPAAPPRLAGRSGGEIAVLSLAGRYAGAETDEGDLSAFWNLLIEGRSGLSRLTEEELDAFGVRESLRKRLDYVPVAGHLRGIEAFDAALFGLSQREASLTDPQHRLFLESCWRALEFAGYAPRGAEDALAAQGRRGGVGVFAGCWLPLYLTHHLGGAAALDPTDPTGFHLAEVGNDKDYLASRAAYLLNLTGPAVAVQTSCSTGLTAIAQAVEALRDGRCAMALAGAASLMLPRGGYVAEHGHVGSPSGACRTFDAEADGVVFSDGVGATALKRLEDALSDGDPILAVIKGAAISSDGAGKAGFSAPSARGQEKTLAAALEDAGCAPESVGYIEAHGTGTVIGDPIETTALSRVYGSANAAGGGARKGAVRLGSIKPNIGHANIAAGVAGFAKATLALQKKVLPPTIGVETPNPKLGLELGPLALQRVAEPWSRSGGPRRAGVTSLGVGGVNCHLILEEPPEFAAAQVETPEALLLSARSAEGLAELARATADRLERGGLDLAGVAETLRAGRETMTHRLAVAAADLATAPERLRAAAERVAPAPAFKQPPRLALVFPGHGSQHALMGLDLHRVCPAFRERFEHCRELFCDLTQGEIDLSALLQPGRSEALLARPAALQAAVFAVQAAMTATLEAAGTSPIAFAGHSLGEYAAAVAAGALELETAAALVAARGEACEAAPPGAMLAARGDEAAIEALAKSEGLAIAGRNGPGELSLAGAPDRIDAFIEAASDKGLAATRLSAPRAFHSPLMEEAAQRFREAAQSLSATRLFGAPRKPFISTLTGAWAAPGAPLGPEYWAEQMRRPVLFGAAMRALAEDGVEMALEVGPGRGLSRLIAKARSGDEDRAGTGRAMSVVSAMRHPGDRAHDLDALHRALGQLWESGAELRWDALVQRDGPPPRRVDLPGPRFERKRCWIAAAEPRPLTQAPPPTPAMEALCAAEDRLRLPGFARALPAEEAAPGAFHWRAVVDDPAGPVERALLEALRASGDALEILDLRAALAKPLDGIDRILWLRGVFAEEPLTPAAELARFAAHLAETITAPATVFALSAGALPVGSERLRPEAGLRLGPLLSLGQEAAPIGVRAVDIDPSRPARPEAIRRELRAENLRPEPFCALRGPHLWTENFAPVAAASATAAKNGRALLSDQSQRGGFVVTGGFGRIGLALAGRLCAHGAPMLLAGRNPARAEAEIAALRAQGAQIASLALDIAAPGEARRLLREAESQFGGVRGVFHAAGLADLKYLGETTASTLEAEFAAKVDGARALAAAVEALERPPEFVALFSSLAAPLGGLGMSGYGAANRFLDLFAEAEATKGGATRWLSIAWDDWAFDYGKEQVGAWARTRAGLSLPPEEALDMLEALLGAEGPPRICVCATPLEPRLIRWRHDATRAATEPQEKGMPPGANGAPADDPYLRATLEAYRAVLGEDEVLPGSDFFDLGGDSLLATQLVAHLARSLAAIGSNGPKPRIADVFDHSTPQRLAAQLSQRA